MDPLSIAILGGLIATVGGSVVVAVAKSSPTVMRFLRRRLAGADILILGDTQAGKTSLWNFLRHGVFADTFPPITTLSPESIDGFTVERPDGKGFDVKGTEDIPGEWDPVEVMGVISRQRPDLITVLCSAADAPSAISWFRAFCSRLNLLLLENRAVARKLRAMVVVQSKMDLASSEQLVKSEEALRDVLRTELVAALKNKATEIPVVRCTFYKSKGGEPRANELVLVMTRLLESTDSLAVTYDG